MQHETNINLSAVTTARLVLAVSQIEGTKFVGLTYTDKKAGEQARHVLNMGASYENAKTRDLATLSARENIAVDVAATRFLVKAVDATAKDTPERKAANAALKSFQAMIGWERAAAAEVFISLENSNAAFTLGVENPEYTQAGHWETLCPGFRIGVVGSPAEGKAQAYGYSVSRKTLTPGVWPVVNSHPKTVAKDAIRATLSTGKFRTFSLEREHFESIRIAGVAIDAE
jgi:hypothetical protein